MKKTFLPRSASPFRLADKAVAYLANAGALKPSGATPNERQKLSAYWTSRLRACKKALITDEVARAAGYLMTWEPQTLLRMLPSCRLPFDTMWLEWNMLAPHLAGTESRGEGIELDKNARHLGIFMERMGQTSFRITYFSEHDDVVSPYPISYEVDISDNPYPGVETDQDRSLSRDALSGIVPVTLPHVSRIKEQEESIKIAETRLAAHENLSLHVVVAPTPILGPIWDRLCRNTEQYEAENPHLGKDWDQGQANPNALKIMSQFDHLESRDMQMSWEIPLAILAIMNCREVILKDQPPIPKDETRFFRGGRQVRVHEYGVVTMEVPRQILVADLTEKTRTENEAGRGFRQHEVEGHWKNRRKLGSNSCSHAWADEGNSQSCGLCGAHRWWTNNFVRGEAALGVIVRDRILSSRRDEVLEDASMHIPAPTRK